MNFEELEHIVRAAKDLTGETEFIAIGSQSLLISLPDEQGRAPRLSDPVRRAIDEGRGKGNPER